MILSPCKQCKQVGSKCNSSLLGYHFCKHAQRFCSTWMTSQMPIKKRGLVILDWYFGEGMETNSGVEKAKKQKGMTKYSLKTMCTQNKWANEETLKCLYTQFLKNLSSFLSDFLPSHLASHPMATFYVTLITGCYCSELVDYTRS